MLIGKAFLELIFPPLCSTCKERSEVKFFCSSCWEACAPPDPIDRCPHCFEESEGVCKRCRNDPIIPFKRASVFDSTQPAFLLARKRPDLLASFAVFQWVQLDWPMPDVVIPMPGAYEFGLSFSKMIDRPFAPVFKRGGCDSEMIDTDQVLLLIEHGNNAEEQKKAIDCLAETFPKRGYLLSLFTDDFPNF